MGKGSKGGGGSGGSKGGSGGSKGGGSKGGGKSQAGWPSRTAIRPAAAGTMRRRRSRQVFGWPEGSRCRLAVHRAIGGTAVSTADRVSTNRVIRDTGPPAPESPDD